MTAKPFAYLIRLSFGLTLGIMVFVMLECHPDDLWTRFQSILDGEEVELITITECHRT